MSSVPAVQEFEVGREFVLESCVNVPEGLVGRTRGESPSDDSSGILHATDPPPSEPQTDSPLPSLLLSTLKAESVPSPDGTAACSVAQPARAMQADFKSPGSRFFARGLGQWVGLPRDTQPARGAPAHMLRNAHSLYLASNS